MNEDENSTMFIDCLVCKIYKEFESKNKQLRIYAPIKYWNQASKYKNRRLREELIKLKNSRKIY